MKALSHSSPSRAPTSVFEAARRCAPSDREDGAQAEGVARVADPCSPAKQSRPAETGIRGRFPKASKLLRHADFQRVYKQGRRHFAAHMTVFFLRRGDNDKDDVGGGPRVGFTVGRVLGGAVQRNRIKRRLREAVRRNLASLALAVDVVIHPKKSALVAELAVLNDELACAFQLIGEKESRRG